MITFQFPQRHVAKKLLTVSRKTLRWKKKNANFSPQRYKSSETKRTLSSAFFDKSATCHSIQLDTLSRGVLETRELQVSKYLRRSTRESWRNDYYSLGVSRDLKGLTEHRACIFFSPARPSSSSLFLSPTDVAWPLINAFYSSRVGLSALIRVTSTYAATKASFSQQSLEGVTLRHSQLELL